MSFAAFTNNLSPQDFQNLGTFFHFIEHELTQTIRHPNNYRAHFLKENTNLVTAQGKIHISVIISGVIFVQSDSLLKLKQFILSKNNYISDEDIKVGFNTDEKCIVIQIDSKCFQKFQPSFRSTNTFHGGYGTTNPFATNNGGYGYGYGYQQQYGTFNPYIVQSQPNNSFIQKYTSKKYIIVLLVIVMAIGFFSYGSKNPNSDNKTEKEPENEDSSFWYNVFGRMKKINVAKMKIEDLNKKQNDPTDLNPDDKKK